MNTNPETNKSLSLTDVNQILSDALLQLSDRKISPKRAQSISRIALALSKNIAHVDLQKRVEFLEQVLQNRK
jgi:hypothetical protein